MRAHFCACLNLFLKILITSLIVGSSCVCMECEPIVCLDYSKQEIDWADVINKILDVKENKCLVALNLSDCGLSDFLELAPGNGLPIFEIDLSNNAHLGANGLSGLIELEMLKQVNLSGTMVLSSDDIVDKLENEFCVNVIVGPSLGESVSG